MGRMARRVGLTFLLSGFALNSNAPAAHAQELPVELLWHACPFLLGTAADAALRKLQLPREEIDAIADIACNVAQAYQQLAANPPAAPAEDARTAEEIFCEGSFLESCAGIRGSAQMTPAMRCWMKGLTVEQCAVEAIQSEAGRR